MMKTWICKTCSNENDRPNNSDICWYCGLAKGHEPKKIYWTIKPGTESDVSKVEGIFIRHVADFLSSSEAKQAVLAVNSFDDSLELARMICGDYEGYTEERILGNFGPKTLRAVMKAREILDKMKEVK